VRNFWIDARVDGRPNDLGFGPKAKDGGFEMTVYIRGEGTVYEGITLRGYESAGQLVLWAQGPNGQRIEIRTNR